MAHRLGRPGEARAGERRAQAQASAAEQAAQSAASAFRQLAASTDVQSFATTLQSQSFSSRLNAVDSTYKQLHAALTG